jgi:hypothetical protein
MREAMWEPEERVEVDESGKGDGPTAENREGVMV